MILINDRCYIVKSHIQNKIAFKCAKKSQITRETNPKHQKQRIESSRSLEKSNRWNHLRYRLCSQLQTVRFIKVRFGCDSKKLLSLRLEGASLRLPGNSLQMYYGDSFVSNKPNVSISHQVSRVREVFERRSAHRNLVSRYYKDSEPHRD